MEGRIQDEFKIGNQPEKLQTPQGFAVKFSISQAFKQLTSKKKPNIKVLRTDLYAKDVDQLFFDVQFGKLSQIQFQQVPRLLMYFISKDQTFSLLPNKQYKNPVTRVKMIKEYQQQQMKYNEYLKRFRKDEHCRRCQFERYKKQSLLQLSKMHLLASTFGNRL